jgi:hypothetical protein
MRDVALSKQVGLFCQARRTECNVEVRELRVSSLRCASFDFAQDRNDNSWVRVTRDGWVAGAWGSEVGL